MAAPASDFRALEQQNRRQTMVLVAVVIVLFVALGFGLDLVAGDVGLSDGHVVGFPVLSIAALAFGSMQALVSFYGGANLVLLSVHARALEPDSVRHQTVLDVIREMSLASRMPMPKPYVIDDPSPNAFATGRDPAHSVICVTQGLIDQMDREELQGVIGHEMAHVRDYDIRTMTMIAVMIGGIAMLSDFVFRMSFYGGFRGRSRDNNRDGGGAGALIAVAVILLAAVAPIFAQLLAMAVSREREYLADASSVEFTRNPRALLRALERIAEVESPLKEATAGTAHLFMVNPREGLREEDREGFFDRLLSTHPPLGKRIERLRALLHESETVGAVESGSAAR
ncbi:MAG TPA: M48 family metallopeptidase [Candidatus Binataceae bacterium]|nr:M48 family metallopeptidase [Candidatus Binataceae bacterium]